jgi:small-conductance mechanosensitive channel
MRSVRALIRAGLIALAVISLAGPAGAQAPAVAPPAAAPRAAPAPTSDAQQVLDILRDPTRRAALEATLETIVQAAPKAAAPAPATAAAPGAPAAAPAATPAPAATAGVAGLIKPQAAQPAAKPVKSVADALPLEPNSVGANVLVGATQMLDHASDDLKQGFSAIRSLPALMGWFETMTTDPLARATLIAVGWRLIVAVAIAMAVEWGAWRLLARPRTLLAAMAPAPPNTPTIISEDEVTANEDDEGNGGDESAESNGDAQPEYEADPESGADDTTDAPLFARAAIRLQHAAHNHHLSDRIRLRRTTAWMLLRRLPLVAAMLALDLVPIAAFAIVGHVLSESGLAPTRFTRLVMLAVIDAYVVCRTALSVGRMMLAPEHPRLRLLHWSDSAAHYGQRWLRRMLIVGVFGYAAAEVGLLFGLSPVAHEAVIKAAGFVVHVMLAVIVWQKRRSIRALLRARDGATGMFALIRNRFAAVWHWVALFYIAALWFVWAVELPHGYQRIMHVFFVTAGTIAVARVATIVILGVLHRAMHVDPTTASRMPGLHTRARFYLPLVRRVVIALMWTLTLATLCQLWGLGVLDWLVGSPLGQSVMGAIITIGITMLLALGGWEAANLAIEQHLARLSEEAQAAKIARLRTLLPLLRTLLIAVIGVVTGLVVLSQIGINIAPLLAGAGILGVAIGFGSQKLVQDLITGIFLLLENTMQVGDWVTVSGLSGTVEALSVRTIRLRASDGSVHIIPFSAVTSVTNTNRGLGNAMVNVTVDFAEDTDRVCAVVTQIVDEMRTDPEFTGRILAPLSLWGVDHVDGSSVTIAGQVLCTDSGRWAVQREFNRRMKRRFQELGIHIYRPNQAYLREPEHKPPTTATTGAVKLAHAGE